MRRPLLGALAAGALAAGALAAAGALLLAAPATAGSVFAVGGLGEPSLEENARVRAMGGAGAAEHGTSAFSSVNPASIAEARHLTLEATVLAAGRRVSTVSYGSESAHETSFPGIRMFVRLPAKLVLGGGYLIGTNGGFEIERAESAGAASRLFVEGRGGIDFVRVTLARAVTPEIRAGIDYDIIAGSYREEWTRTFSDPNLAPARDTLEVSWDRLGRWRLGAQYARAGFAVGAVYETGRRLSLLERLRTSGSSVTAPGRTLRIPSGFAAGVGASLGSRGRIVGQYRRQSWSRESLESDRVDFRALERYSLGFELAAAGGGSLLGELPLRLGATFLRWPDLLPRAGASDITGGTAEVDEWALSVGSGIRTRDGGGSIDWSLEGGRRGSEDELGARETFFRVAVSLRVSDETWK